jgi:hypothetical protein
VAAEGGILAALECLPGRPFPERSNK